jgi:hypothetical protein
MYVGIAAGGRYRLRSASLFDQNALAFDGTGTQTLFRALRQVFQRESGEGGFRALIRSRSARASLSDIVGYSPSAAMLALPA